MNTIVLLFSSLMLTFGLHEDDPKRLDRRPPYVGPGYRLAWPGKQAPEFPAANIQLYSWLSLGEMMPNTLSGNDCWGYVSAAGRQIALMGLNSGTAVVDVSFPADARLIASIAGPDSIWRDIKVYRDFAYVVSEGGGGIQVLDLSKVDLGVVRLVGNIGDGQQAATHNVALNEETGYLYRCGGGNHGLRIYSLSQPDAPVQVAAWNDRYVHDAQAVLMKSGPFQGRELVFCCAGFNGGWDLTGLTILDVTDKANIRTLTHYEYLLPAYSHQGWLSQDQQTFYLNDELDERTYSVTTRTRVVDVSDPTHPKEIGVFSSGSRSIDHNLYTRDSLIFEANYRSGLRLFDASLPHQPTEIGFFDTFPEDDNAQFNGLWSNYPFFPSGTVIGSDIERGLFVLRTKPLLGDFDASGEVSQSDLTPLFQAWGQSCSSCAADLDGSGRVTSQDLTRLLTAWDNGLSGHPAMP
jgi:choice-of-anchor B domain-containing protein